MPTRRVDGTDNGGSSASSPGGGVVHDITGDRLLTPVPADCRRQDSSHCLSQCLVLSAAAAAALWRLTDASPSLQRNPRTAASGVRCVKIVIRSICPSTICKQSWSRRVVEVLRTKIIDSLLSLQYGLTTVTIYR